MTEYGILPGLVSLATNIQLPNRLVISPFPNLRHLNLCTNPPGSLPPSPPPLPNLTHLTLSALPPAGPAFAPCFPSLTYLHITTLPLPGFRGFANPFLGDLPHALPPTLTHFATDSVLTREACEALPDVLARLDILNGARHDLDAVRERWLGAGRVGLAELALVGRPGRRPRSSEAPPAAHTTIDDLIRAGCEVSLR